MGLFYEVKFNYISRIGNLATGIRKFQFRTIVLKMSVQSLYNSYRRNYS